MPTTEERPDHEASEPMPIYEHYCADCHTVFSFFTARPAAIAPACPRCGRPDLERKPSRFATVRARDTGGGGDQAVDPGDPFAGVDERRLDHAMNALARSMEGADEDDPRAVGRLMREFGSLTGLDLGAEGEALVQRLESGEDPDTIEREMASLESSDGGVAAFFRLKKAATRRAPPRVDDELHFL